jgi:6-phosphogluconolactonase
MNRTRSLFAWLSHLSLPHPRRLQRQAGVGHPATALDRRHGNTQMIRAEWCCVSMTVFALAACIGCGGGSSSQTTNNTPHAPSYYAYIADANTFAATASLTTYSEASGQLTPVGSPISISEAACGLTVSPNNKILYLETCITGWIQPYSIDPNTGALTAVGGGTSVNIPGPSYGVISPLIVAPNGEFAYVVNQSAGTVVIYSIGSDGSLTAAGSLSKGGTTIAIAPVGDFLYVATGGGFVFAFAVDANSGGLTPVQGNPFALNDGGNFLDAPVALAVAPSGKYLYAPDDDDVFTIFSVAPNTGVLTAVNSYPPPPLNFVNGGGPVVLNTAGTVAYMQGLGDIAAYSVDATTGAVSQTAVTGNSCQTSGAYTRSYVGPPVPEIALDPAGDHLYALWIRCGITGLGEVSAYSVDASTGALTYVGPVTGTGDTTPLAIAFATE